MRGRIALVVSAFAGRPFVTALLNKVLSRALTRSLSVEVLAFSESDNVPDSFFTEALSSLRKQARRYKAVVILCAPPVQRVIDALSQPLAVPTVFVDVDPFEKQPDKKPKGFVLVASNPERGCTDAADLVMRKVKDRKTRRIAILKGDFQSAREQCFRRNLKPGTVVLEEHPLDFSREKAAKWADRYATKFDAIFATNDEMALGVLDVLRRKQSASRPLVLVGFDGLEEFKRMGALSLKCALATVEQSVNLLAIRTIEAVVRHQGHLVDTDCREIPS